MMKLTCIIVFLTISIHQASFQKTPLEPKTITDETLKQLLEFFRSLADPYTQIPDQNIFLNSTTFVNATMTNGTVGNLTAFETVSTHADMNNLIFGINITFPNLTISGFYSIDSDSDAFTLVGQGPFRLELSNLSLAANLSLSLKKDKTLELKNLTIDYTQTTIKVAIDDLGGNEEVSDTLNELINIALPEMITVLKPNAQEVVQEMAKLYGAFVFGNMTVQQFIDFIYSFIT